MADEYLAGEISFGEFGERRLCGGGTGEVLSSQWIRALGYVGQRLGMVPRLVPSGLLREIA